MKGRGKEETQKGKDVSEDTNESERRERWKGEDEWVGGKGTVRT